MMANARLSGPRGTYGCACKSRDAADDMDEVAQQYARKAL